MRNQQTNQGFTLVELLVAMAIFSLMTAVAYAGLAAVMQNDQSSLAHETALKKVQRAMVFIEKDLRQLSTRTRNDGYSDLQPGLKSDGGGSVLLEFSRTGNSNPTDLARSSLQRIQYLIDEENEWRQRRWDLLTNRVEDVDFIQHLRDRKVLKQNGISLEDIVDMIMLIHFDQEDYDQ